MAAELSYADVRPGMVAHSTVRTAHVLLLVKFASKPLGVTIGRVTRFAHILDEIVLNIVNHVPIVQLPSQFREKVKKKFLIKRNNCYKIM